MKDTSKNYSPLSFDICENKAAAHAFNADENGTGANIKIRIFCPLLIGQLHMSGTSVVKVS